MSSHMVDPGTIDLVVHVVCELRRRQGKAGYWAECMEPADTNRRTALGQELFLINAAGVASRYTELPDCSEAQAYRYKSSWVGTSKIQQWKALCSFIYQCSEESVPSLHIYKEVEAAGHLLADEIIEKLPEYGAASWAFERPSSIPVLLIGGIR